MKTALALAVALAVAVALALFIRALVYALVDAVHLLADRKKGAISVNQEADAEHDDIHGRRERRFVWEFSFSLTCAIMTSGLYSVVAWIAGNQASHIHFLRIARADIHPFLVISMAISLWLCPLFMIWYVYEAGFKPAIVLLCIASGSSATFDSFGKACLTGQRVAHQHRRYRRCARASSVPSQKFLVITTGS